MHIAGLTKFPVRKITAGCVLLDSTRASLHEVAPFLRIADELCMGQVLHSNSNMRQ